MQATTDKRLVALVMPGKPVAPLSWSLRVPLAVGTRLDKPETSVYCQEPSLLFSDPSKVTL